MEKIYRVLSNAENLAEFSDTATILLNIASRLHAARGDPVIWREALDACRDWFGCVDALNIGDTFAVTADQLAASIENVARCASEGLGCCRDDAIKRGRCLALVPHLQDSVFAIRQSLKSEFFNQIAPTWIVDRDGLVIEANRVAVALTTAGEHFELVSGRISPRFKGATARLHKMLPDVSGETLFSWPDPPGGETSLRLIPHPDGKAIIVTLVGDVANTDDTAVQLAELLDLTPRQSELAAHLLAGHSISSSARSMGISRETAKDHLAALLLRTGAANRLEFVSICLRCLHY